MTDTELLASAMRSILTSKGEYVEVPDYPAEDITLDGTWNLSADEMAAVRRVWDTVERPDPVLTVPIPAGATVYVVEAPAATRWFLIEAEAVAYQREAGGIIKMSNQHSSVA